ncbi:ABC transporter substrate-binding protein, partial [Candidatus Aerophobetes bacterium]
MRIMKKRRSRLRTFVAIGALVGTLFGGLSSILLAAEFPLRIVDGLGREVNISKPPETIVSLAPSNTEILFALGLVDKLVAVSQYCNYPPEVQNKPKVGGFSTINIEKVVSLEPDLVLATGGVQKKVV